MVGAASSLRPSNCIINKITEEREDTMQLNTSYIYLNDVRLRACHGVLPQEQAVGADFVVNLRVGFDIAKAMATDDVGDTLNYATLYNIVKREMDQPSKLLEHVAGRMAKAIEVAFPDVTAIDLSITKANPPMGADCKGAGVELHFGR